VQVFAIEGIGWGAMGKRPKKRDYGDKTRIDMNQPYQVTYWKQRFGVSDQNLRMQCAR
jgi:hypothetical protein